MQGNLLRLVSIVSWFLLLGLAAPLCRGELPGDYFPKLNKGLGRVERVMAAMPEGGLSELERQPGMRHFPSGVLVAAVLYAKEHPANRRYHDPRTLTTALAIGDLIAREIALGAYGRLDNHRDTYMWLDAYRLLEGELGEPRRKRWREALMGLVAPLAADVDERKDYPWYNSPYIVTSPNHYSLWSSTVHLAGKVFVVSTPTASQFYLDRQTVMGVFHEKLGLIISGANSKHQPELATVSETVKGEVYHMPMSSRLTMTEQGDRLALGYNKFFSELTFPELSEDRLRFRFRVRWKGGAAPARLTLQLVLRSGEILETGGGKRVKLSTEPLRLSPEDIGGWIRHGGWTLKTDAPVELEWPVYPYNPYSARPETGLAHAVGACRLELEPRSQVVDFTLETR